MEVMMRQPRSSQVHVSQAVPGASPLTWAMEGDPEINKVRLSKMSVFTEYIFFLLQIHVSQNAADDSSPLSCSPACPQGGAGDSSSSGKSVSQITNFVLSQMVDKYFLSQNLMEADQSPPKVQ